MHGQHDRAEMEASFINHWARRKPLGETIHRYRLWTDSGLEEFARELFFAGCECERELQGENWEAA